MNKSPYLNYVLLLNVNITPAI